MKFLNQLLQQFFFAVYALDSTDNKINEGETVLNPNWLLTNRQIHKNQLRNRRLDDTGGCGRNQVCFEKYEEGSRYQAWPDGFCNKYNECGGQNPNSECFCQSDSYEPPIKPYLFEHVSDYSGIVSYFPSGFPSFEIEPFLDGPGTQIYRIVNDTLPYDGILPEDAITLAEYAFSLQDFFLEGEIFAIENIEPIPSYFGFGDMLLYTELNFGFRVLESGTYRFHVNFVNDVYQKNGFRFQIRHRDYLPELSEEEKQIVYDQIRADEQREYSNSFVMEAGFSFLMTINGWTSGLSGETFMTWRLEKM